jgi:VWFA-related protein
MRLIATVLLLVLALPPGDVPRLSAQQPAPAAPPAAQAPGGGQAPTIRGGIDAVRVDVFATDNKGNPITDLKQSDFEIIEDGAPQVIDQFRTVKIDGNPIEPTSYEGTRALSDDQVRALDDDSRLFVFFLDDYHTRDRSAIAVRETLIRFIENQLRPTDLLAIMYPLSGIADVTFTRNHESIISGISRFEGRKYNYTPRNQAERELERQRASTVDIERMRNRIVQGALEGLAMKLGSLRDERKTVIFVSEGFIVTLPPEMRRADPNMPQQATVVDPEIEKDLELKGWMDLELRMREVYRSLNRFNTSIYALDPRGLAPFEFDINDGGPGGVSMGSDRNTLRQSQDTLRAIAEESDGPGHPEHQRVARRPRADAEGLQLLLPARVQRPDEA